MNLTSTPTSPASQLEHALRNGGIAVVRTDTIYGVIALAANETAVEKVYQAKKRNPAKQCIVLLADSNDAPAHNELITQYSGEARPTTIIVPATTEPEWLLRGGTTIAYRVVESGLLHDVIAKIGPVIAPSANPEGMAPASTIEQAQQYFGASVDVYVDAGTVPADAQPSKIIEIKDDNHVIVVRP